MAKTKKPTASPSKTKTPAAPAKPQAPAAPLIDTSLAAATAARMIAARNLQSAAAPPTPATPADKPNESAAFKQLKQGLAKPAPALAGNLAPIAGHGKSNLPHTFVKQTGHNQTFGADVNRSGVPRRTGG